MTGHGRVAYITVSIDETDHSAFVMRVDKGSDHSDGIAFRLALEAASGAS
jgi:hypothetical protein